MKRFAGIWLLLALWVSLLQAQIPAGYYYQARAKSKDALKTALYELAQPQKVLKYGSGEGATWEGFFSTDQKPDGSVYDMYSNIVRYFNGFNGVSGMHIEHSLPKSWWGGTNNFAYRDLYHLFPSDGITNSTKNNYPLGVVGPNPRLDNGVSKVGNNVFGSVYAGLCFEPADEYKGDFARAYLYISTVYQNLAPFWTSPMMQRNTYPVWNKWAIDLLLQWHKQDPVSVKERVRQEKVFNIQQNRNPFVDYPALADYIWGKDTLKIFPFPEETEAFLVSPRAGQSMVFDLILQGDSLNRSLWIQGVNMNTSATLQLKNSGSHFFFENTTLSPNELLAGKSVSLVFAPQSSGTFRDTLVISGGGLENVVQIPLQGRSAPEFLTLNADDITPVGARMNWIPDPKAEAYRVSLQQGATSAGNLIISTYVEWTGLDKAIEIFNGTGRTVNLEDYTLQKQSNGAGAFESTYRLRGTLENGQTHLLVHRLSSNTALKQLAHAITDSVLNFNGNDAVALLHHGLMIDMVGVADGGEALVWGLDRTMRRKSAVTHPQLVFNAEEWDVLPMDQLSLIGVHQMQFDQTIVPVASYEIAPGSSFLVSGLIPESNYHYKVESYSNNAWQATINSVRFRTAILETPVVMDALSVSETAFVANWEQDLYVNTYEIDVYMLKGTADTTIFEGFDQLGSGGKPLPAGWTGTASGTYTTTTSSGTAIPALQLANTGEFVQTAVYPHAVTAFGFMYRYPSGATGSYFFVEALKGGSWVRIDSIWYVNTSKYFLNYTFDKSEEINAFRIIYKLKVSGNIALDDFRITYGNQTAEYLLQELPVTGIETLIDNLLPGKTYYYRVRSAHAGKYSAWSEPVQVKTLQASSVNNPVSQLRLTVLPGLLRVEDLRGDELLSVYNTAGVCVSRVQASYNTANIPLNGKGLFILVVHHPDYRYVRKILF
jgi:hypothetical protein